MGNLLDLYRITPPDDFTASYEIKPVAFVASLNVDGTLAVFSELGDNNNSLLIPYAKVSVGVTPQLGVDKLNYFYDGSGDFKNYDKERAALIKLHRAVAGNDPYLCSLLERVATATESGVIWRAVVKHYDMQYTAYVETQLAHQAKLGKINKKNEVDPNRHPLTSAINKSKGALPSVLIATMCAETGQYIHDDSAVVNAWAPLWTELKLKSAGAAKTCTLTGEVGRAMPAASPIKINVAGMSGVILGAATDINNASFGANANADHGLTIETMMRLHSNLAFLGRDRRRYQIIGKDHSAIYWVEGETTAPPIFEMLRSFSLASSSNAPNTASDSNKGEGHIVNAPLEVNEALKSIWRGAGLVDRNLRASGNRVHSIRLKKPNKGTTIFVPGESAYVNDLLSNIALFHSRQLIVSRYSKGIKALLSVLRPPSKGDNFPAREAVIMHDHALYGRALPKSWLPTIQRRMEICCRPDVSQIADATKRKQTINDGYTLKALWMLTSPHICNIFMAVMTDFTEKITPGKVEIITNSTTETTMTNAAAQPLIGQIPADHAHVKALEALTPEQQQAYLLGVWLSKVTRFANQHVKDGRNYATKSFSTVITRPAKGYVELAERHRAIANGKKAKDGRKAYDSAPAAAADIKAISAVMTLPDRASVAYKEQIWTGYEIETQLGWARITQANVDKAANAA